MGHRWGKGVTQKPLILLFASLFPAALSRERFFYALLFAWLQIKGVSLDLLDNVLLLNLALKASQRILKRLTLLQPDFRQRNNTPKLVPYGPG